MNYICLEKVVTPTVWAKGIINLISKKASADPRIPTNYRGITLATCLYKMIYGNILHSRLMTWDEVNEYIYIYQMNKIGSLKFAAIMSIIETRKQKRKRTFVVFIDFSKAYGRIDRNLLWGKLSWRSLDKK